MAPGTVPAGAGGCKQRWQRHHISVPKIAMPRGRSVRYPSNDVVLPVQVDANDGTAGPLAPIGRGLAEKAFSQPSSRRLWRPYNDGHSVEQPSTVLLLEGIEARDVVR